MPDSEISPRAQAEVNVGTAVAEAVEIPPEFVELSELRWAALDRKLGYFGQQRFVIVGFSQRANEVFWKDGQTSGFGLGRWQFFLDTVAPLGARHSLDLGGMDHPATHVIVLDRHRQVVYATCRECAEAFAARAYGKLVPKRQCMCPARAGRVESGNPEPKRARCGGQAGSDPGNHPPEDGPAHP